MILLGMTILGLLVGAGLGLTALYFNPTIDTPPEPPSTSQRVLSYAFPGRDALALTHGGYLGLPSIPRSITPLWEESIKNSVLLTAGLKDPQGETVALGTQIGVPSSKTELLSTGVIVDEYWLISVPGSGSFFVHVENNFWPFIKDAIVGVEYLGRPWPGTAVYHPTHGPGSTKGGIVYGGSGEFMRLEGGASETYYLNHFSEIGGIESLSVELRLDLVGTGLSLALSP